MAKISITGEQSLKKSIFFLDYLISVERFALVCVCVCLSSAVEPAGGEETGFLRSPQEEEQRNGTASPSGGRNGKLQFPDRIKYPCMHTHYVSICLECVHAFK